MTLLISGGPAGQAANDNKYADCGGSRLRE